MEVSKNYTTRLHREFAEIQLSGDHPAARKTRKVYKSRTCGTLMSKIAQSIKTSPQSDNKHQLVAAKSMILHATSRNHQWTGIGPLSIKTFPRGEAHYHVEGGRFRVDETGYLLLNAGQEYTVIVDSEQPVESFCLFFADGFAEDVAATLQHAVEDLLDDPAGNRRTALQFYDRSYRHNAELATILAQLRNHHQKLGADSGWQEELFHQVMQRLLHVHHQVVGEVASLPAMRATTREEIYRRVHRVRDYILACYEQPLTLPEMAQIGCLSTNHFLRVFRQVFHQSPHHFLRTIRIEQAQKLLITTDLSVTQICYAVGFESLGSFSWRFRQEVGLSPEQFRRAKW